MFCPTLQKIPIFHLPGDFHRDFDIWSYGFFCVLRTVYELSFLSRLQIEILVNYFTDESKTQSCLWFDNSLAHRRYLYQIAFDFIDHGRTSPNRWYSIFGLIFFIIKSVTKNSDIIEYVT